MRLYLVYTLFSFGTRKYATSFRAFVMSSRTGMKNKVQMPALLTMEALGARAIKRRRATAGVSNQNYQSNDTTPPPRLTLATKDFEVTLSDAARASDEALCDGDATGLVGNLISDGDATGLVGNLISDGDGSGGVLVVSNSLSPRSIFLTSSHRVAHLNHEDTKETKDTKHTKPLRGHTEGWTDLCVPPEELRPAFSLMNGQCFNWRQAAGDCWVGVLGGEVIAIRQKPRTTLFRSLSTKNIKINNNHEGGVKSSASAPESASTTVAARLRDYFFLAEPLKPLYERWSQGDPRMAAVAAALPGVRVVRQDPVECIFSFICSSNNNIPRITTMLQKLRRAYGELLFSVGEGGLAATGLLGDLLGDCDDSSSARELLIEDWTRKPMEFYSFPTVETLAQRATEANLRDMGFGYRAKYIIESAKHMLDGGGADWALQMRTQERHHVRDRLVALNGVGPKVADCVALFCMDQTSAIPVDVHVWRIACRDYDPTLQDCKSLTPTVYARVGDLFRERFGERAGWAHSLLFAAELPAFKVLLPPEIQGEMDDFREEERASKAEARAGKTQSKTQSKSQSKGRTKGQTQRKGKKRQSQPAVKARDVFTSIKHGTAT